MSPIRQPKTFKDKAATVRLHSPWDRWLKDTFGIANWTLESYIGKRTLEIGFGWLIGWVG